MAALHQVKWPGWKINRPGSSPGSALPSPAYCFSSVIVWTENKNVTISDRFICFTLTVKRRWRPVFWGPQLKRSSNFLREKRAPRWPRWGIFWPRNDLALYCAGAATVSKPLNSTPHPPPLNKKCHFSRSRGCTIAFTGCTYKFPPKLDPKSVFSLWRRTCTHCTPWGYERSIRSQIIRSLDHFSPSRFDILYSRLSLPSAAPEVRRPLFLLQIRFPDIFVFLCDLVVSTIALTWRCCHHFFSTLSKVKIKVNVDLYSLLSTHF